MAGWFRYSRSSIRGWDTIPDRRWYRHQWHASPGMEERCMKDGKIFFNFKTNTSINQSINRSNKFMTHITNQSINRSNDLRTDWPANPSINQPNAAGLINRPTKLYETSFCGFQSWENAVNFWSRLLCKVVVIVQSRKKQTHRSEFYD